MGTRDIQNGLNAINFSDCKEKEDMYAKTMETYIKYAGKVYKTLDFKNSLGLTWYKIEDKPGHYDWVHGVVFVKED